MNCRVQILIALSRGIPSREAEALPSVEVIPPYVKCTRFQFDLYSLPDANLFVSRIGDVELVGVGFWPPRAQIQSVFDVLTRDYLFVLNGRGIRNPRRVIKQRICCLLYTS